MTQIRIDTEHTREVARRLIVESDRLAEIGHELQHAIGGLDTWAWDGRSRSRAEPLLSRVRPESARAADSLDELGRKLRCVADTFEQEDNTAAQNLEGMPWVDFETSVSAVPTPTPAPIPATQTKSDEKGKEKSFLEQVGDWLGRGGNLVDFGKIFPLAVGLLGVKYMSGLSGNVLKDAWLLTGKDLVRTTRDFNKPVGISTMGLALGAVGETVGEIGENWQEYEGDPGKVAGGLLFDIALGVGVSVAGGAVGTAVGSLIGGAVGSVVPIFGTGAGMVIGGKLGGIIGSWYAGRKAEEIEDIKIGDRQLDQTVAETVDQGLSSIVDSVVQLF